MPMQTSTLRILEGAFSTTQAVVLGQAIDEEVKASQFITVPILDARLSDLKVRTLELETRLADRISRVETSVAQSEFRLFNKVIGAGLVATGIILAAVFFIVQHFRP